MPIPSKPCPGELSQETQELLRNSRDRALWGTYPCHVCGRSALRQSEGNGLQSGIALQSGIYSEARTGARWSLLAARLGESGEQIPVESNPKPMGLLFKEPEQVAAETYAPFPRAHRRGNTEPSPAGQPTNVRRHSVGTI